MIWDGAFLPIRKHRDFKHRTVAEHLMDNGVWERGDKVTIDTDPITEKPFDSPQQAQIVDLTYHGKTYRYLIRTAAAAATVAEIRDQINQQMENRVDGGRRLEYYLSSESRLEELLSGLSF